MRFLKYTILPVTLLSLIGCTPSISANNYTAGETQQVSQVAYGVIISTSQVEVAGSHDNLIGSIAGAAAGAILGSTIGQGAGSNLAAIGGGVAGGVVGSKAEAAVTKQTATRYVIKMKSGNTIAVVQGGTPLAVGTEVQVISGHPVQVVPDVPNS